MAVCEQIRLLLGPFEDGELDAHEMQEVAFHVVGCGECKAILDDYRSLAVALRDTIPIPALDRFAASVGARIEQLRVPVRVRLARYLGSLNERLAAGAAIGAAAAVSAILTIVLITPLARKMVNNAAPTPGIVSAIRAPLSATIAKLSANAELAVSGKNPINEKIAVEDKPDAGNPRAIISSLEADNPSVAVWNEPRTGTTVIWVPDQP